MKSIPGRQPLRLDSREPRRGTGWESFVAVQTIEAIQDVAASAARAQLPVVDVAAVSNGRKQSARGPSIIGRRESIARKVADRRGMLKSCLQRPRCQ